MHVVFLRIGSTYHSLNSQFISHFVFSRSDSVGLTMTEDEVLFDDVYELAEVIGK